MTKPSRPKRKKGTNWKFYTKPGKAREKTLAVLQKKSITRPAGPLKQLNIIKKDQKAVSTLLFEALPNEVICHVFSYLKITDLLKCGQVSKRLRAISFDSWPKKLNLEESKVPVRFLQKLLDSGCKYLSLSGAISEGTMNLSKVSRLEYLNLSGFGLKNQDNSSKLLESCYSLQKLSLSRFQLSSKLINSTCLQNGKTLRVLDLSECSLSPNDNSCFNGKYKCSLNPYDNPYDPYDPYDNSCFNGKYTAPIQQIVKNCTELKELSLHRTPLHVESIDILVFNLTPKIEKLDLFHMAYLRDEHVKVLVTRCSKITELNVGGSTLITKHSLNFISEHLESTLVKLDFMLTEFLFNVSDLLVVKNMKKLKFFRFPLYSPDSTRSILKHYEEDRKSMKKLLPNIWVLCSYLEKTRIAVPSQTEYIYNNGLPEINPFQGIWEIKAERKEKAVSLRIQRSIDKCLAQERLNREVLVLHGLRK